MKKKLIAICILSFVIILSACGEKAETKTFTLDNGGINTKLKYTYENDKVISQITHTEMTYDTLGVSTKEEAEAGLSSVTKEYEDLEGVEHKIKFDDDKIIEDIKVNYEKLDFDKAKDIPGFEFSGDTSNGLSMKETEKMLEGMGFEVK